MGGVRHPGPWESAAPVHFPVHSLARSLWVHQLIKETFAPVKDPIKTRGVAEAHLEGDTPADS